MNKKSTKNWKRQLGLGATVVLSSLFLSAGNFSTYNYNPSPLQLSDYQQAKAEICEKIYNDIVGTVRDMRQAPTFKFVYNYNKKPYYNAYYSPKKNTINFGEGIYDLASKFGKDSLNVIAAVMGHELAHFYRDHGWAHAFGKANPDTDIKKEVKKSMYDADTRANMEAEADYYGGIFGYLAGYNTLGVSGAFFDTLYTALELPDEVKGYPSRQDRIKIYGNSKGMLERLIPVFKTANLLNLVQNYEEAALCYDYIIQTFPSREMYNNKGVAFANQALSYYHAEELKLVHPFGLDANTRLALGATRSNEERKKTIEKNLKKSVKAFNKAVQIDENYAPAYVNLALAHTLLGEHDMALGFAGKALKMAEESDQKLLAANAHIARGIAYHNQGKKSDAKNEFKAAKDGNALVADANLEAVTNNIFAKLFKKKAVEVELETETVADVGTDALEALIEDQAEYKAITIKQHNDLKDKTTMVVAEEKDFDAVIVTSTRGTVQGFIMTKNGYDGETEFGIQMGAKLEEIQKEYGKPTRILGGVQGNYLYYEKDAKEGIVFCMDANDKLTAWMVYGKVN